MKKIYIILASLLLSLSNQVSAQGIIHNDTTVQNSAYLKAGIEPATMLTLGYQHKLDMSFMDQDIVTYAELGFSIASIKNNELKVGGILPIFEKKNFKIMNNLNLSYGSVSTINFDSKKFAIADEVALGIYKQKWCLAATIEYEKIYLNYIKNSSFYKETFYEDAVDGWYKGAGGMFQIGIEVGKTFYKKYDVNLEIKMPFSEGFNGYLSPAHANLVIGYRF